ncbi:MAG TPA: hypothetical protein VM284_06010 [Candidatus Limnocylindria bacterium]|nr:hypothetical protein [Candidatus Limnocylindria bacterium]
MLARFGTNMRRAGLLALLLIGMVAPGTARATETFQFQVLRNSCTDSGGDFGKGEVLLKVKVVENGASGANKFTLAAIAQHHRQSNDTWITEFEFDHVKVTFPDDANSYNHTRWFAYDTKDKSEHRIVVVMKVLHNKQVLASRTVVSRSC